MVLSYLDASPCVLILDSAGKINRKYMTSGVIVLVFEIDIIDLCVLL